MKALKKLALVSAVSMISAGAFAMEAMDDESMAAATGQDGITIKVGLGKRDQATLTALGVSSTTFNQIDLTNAAGVATPDTLVKGLSIRQVNIHDDDGLGTLGTDATANSGAIVIGGNLKNADLNGDTVVNAADVAFDSTVVFADNNATDPIVITIDTVGDVDGGGAGSGAMLNVKIHTPKLAVKMGNVYVANSNAAPIGFDADGVALVAPRQVNGIDVDFDGTSVTSGATAAKIANAMELVLGAMDINIQLGNEAQVLFTGQAESADNPNVMVKVDARLIGGLTINNLQSDDSFQSPSIGASTGGGAFRASSLSIVNGTGANAADLDALVGVNIASDIGGDGVGGLVVTVGRLGETLTSGVNVAINDIILGNTAATADMGDVQLLGLNINGTSLIISGH